MREADLAATHCLVVPILNKECRLLSKAPVILKENVSVRTVKSNHVGPILDKRKNYTNVGSKKCIIVDNTSKDISVQDIEEICLSASFALNSSADSPGLIFDDAFLLKHVRSTTVISIFSMTSLSQGGDYLGLKYRIDPDTNPSALKSIYEATLVALKKDPSIKITLRKFNSAVSKTWMEDKTIDMAICLESIFNSQVEIAYKFGLYNTIISGNSPEQRYEIFRILKKLYNQRSNIVHGNKESDIKWVEMNWHTIVSVAKVSIFSKIDFLATHNADEWQAHLDKKALGVVDGEEVD